jgi:hypothetical protein
MMKAVRIQDYSNFEIWTVNSFLRRKNLPSFFFMSIKIISSIFHMTSIITERKDHKQDMQKLDFLWTTKDYTYILPSFPHLHPCPSPAPQLCAL